MSKRRNQSYREKIAAGLPHMSIHRAVVLMAYVYLALPMIIFLLGWCRPLIGIPLAGVCIWSLVLCYRKRDNYIDLEWKFSRADKWKIAVIGATVFAWVVLSGVGGFVWQNTDHASRNSILRILVNYEWPPTTAKRGFVYYVGSWLPAALVGKLSDLNSAHSALFLWVLAGVFLVYALICIWRRKIVLWPLLILISFSGLDIIGSHIFTESDIPVWGKEHLEWWSSLPLYKLQFTSNTSQLYWVFNQAIPVWLVMMLLFLEEPPGNMIWVSTLIAITSTLPFIGLIPILVYYMYRRFAWYTPESVWHGWKMAVQCMGSFQNLAGGGSVLIISFLYLMGNDSFTTINVAGTDKGSSQATSLAIWVPWLLILLAVAVAFLAGTLLIWTARTGKSYILRKIVYIIVAIALLSLFVTYLGADRNRENSIFRLAYIMFFLLIEVGIYLCLLYRDVEDKGLFNVVAVSLIVIPFVSIGNSNDFCMRASIPGLFIVMLWCIESLGKRRMNIRVIALMICLVIGSVTPVHEIKRALVNSCEDYAIEYVDSRRIFNAINFAGSLDTFFWQNIARDNQNTGKFVYSGRRKYEGSNPGWRIRHSYQ